MEPGPRASCYGYAANVRNYLNAQPAPLRHSLGARGALTFVSGTIHALGIKNPAAAGLDSGGSGALIPPAIPAAGVIIVSAFRRVRARFGIDSGIAAAPVTNPFVPPFPGFRFDLFPF